MTSLHHWDYDYLAKILNKKDNMKELTTAEKLDNLLEKAKEKGFEGELKTKAAIVLHKNPGLPELWAYEMTYAEMLKDRLEEDQDNQPFAD
tara:strand:- start:489 stop:761 length:273 start_codon:yes stop_codon:yes gene_type:complete